VFIGEINGAFSLPYDNFFLEVKLFSPFLWVILFLFIPGKIILTITADYPYVVPEMAGGRVSLRSAEDSLARSAAPAHLCSRGQID